MPPVYQMPPFYNRHPWNLIVGWGGILLVLVAVAGLTSWWLLAAPLVLILIIYVVKWVARVYALLTRGYHARRDAGGKLLYEEVHERRVRSLCLELENTEPGHYELFVPTQQDWLQSVPDWAKARREEIAERIATSWKREDVHISDRAVGA